jgi:hypothetical protein
MTPSEYRKTACHLKKTLGQRVTGRTAKDKASFIERRLFFSLSKILNASCPDFAVQLCYKGMQ